MTNAEKLLKDGITTQDFLNEMRTYQPFREYAKYDYNVVNIIKNFLYSTVKPAITDDEKCVLKNLGDEFRTILRTKTGVLKITNKDAVNRNNGQDLKVIDLMQFKNSLFQFIQPGEEYSIEELLEDD